MRQVVFRGVSEDHRGFWNLVSCLVPDVLFFGDNVSLACLLENKRPAWNRLHLPAAAKLFGLLQATQDFETVELVSGRSSLEEPTGESPTIGLLGRECGDCVLEGFASEGACNVAGCDLGWRAVVYPRILPVCWRDGVIFRWKRATGLYVFSSLVGSKICWPP